MGKGVKRIHRFEREEVFDDLLCQKGLDSSRRVPHLPVSKTESNSRSPPRLDEVIDRVFDSFESGTHSPEGSDTGGYSISGTASMGDL